MERSIDPKQPSLLNCGRLFQEFLCDMYSKIEEECLAYHERNQLELRAESLDGLTDALASGDTTTNIGKEARLPSSFVLSPRWMFAHYLDALAIARHYQKFSWFITVTCDPKMTENLDNVPINDVDKWILDNLTLFKKLEPKFSMFCLIFISLM